MKIEITSDPIEVIAFVEEQNKAIADLRQELGALRQREINFFETMHAIVVKGLGLSDPMLEDAPREAADWTALFGSGGFFSDAILKIRTELEAARKDRDADQRTLNVIQRICGDDFCEDLDMRDMGESIDSDLRTAHRKLSAVYRAAHSMVRTNVCHAVHGDWRKEILEEAATIDTTASADVNLSDV